MVLEGYVDLIYRDDDGTLVIVDYKTDAMPRGRDRVQGHLLRPADGCLPGGVERRHRVAGDVDLAVPDP